MSRARLTLVALVALVAAAVSLLAPGIASAHTGLDTSSPADGEIVPGPLPTVVLEFNKPVTPIEGGVVVASAAGATYTPTLLGEGARVTASFEPPLGAGTYTLAWQVRAEDGHVVDGAFSFVVEGAPPTTAAPADAVPTTTLGETPSTTVATTEVTGAAPPPTDSTVAAAPAETAPADTSPASAAAAAPSPPPPPTLSTSAEDGAGVARLGRMIAFPAAVVALGVLVFAATSFAGRIIDLDALGRVVRILAVAIALGSMIELAGLYDSFGSWSSVLDASGGRAALARMLGGVAIAVGLGSLTGAPRPAASLSAAVAGQFETATATGGDDTVDVRWRPRAGNAVGVVGALVIAGSFAFDGHTVTEGPRVWHGLASVVHVIAAAVWAGGVVSLAVLVWRRHRDRIATRALEMTARFSVVAMVALGLAAAAGTAMALMIDADVAGYVDTEWGRTLLVKLAVVAVGAAIGAYNHFVVLPRLRVGPEDPEVLATTRRTLAVEAIALVGAAIVSAVLVAASLI